MKIDLHGYHIHTAWCRFNSLVDLAYYDNVKTCTVITGQGAMMKEFETWAESHPFVVGCKQAKNNPGRFTIKIKKRLT